MKKLLGQSRGLSTIGIIAIIIAVLGVAGGIYLWQTNKTAPPASPSSSQDQTTEWQTYQNEKYGFEIKYPQDWFSRACGDSYIGFSYNENLLPVCFTDSQQPPINIKISADNVGLQKFSDYPMNSLENSQKINTTINNIPAIKISGKIKPLEGPGFPTGTKIISAILSYQKNIYQIYYAERDTKDFSGIFNQILSTFKFTK